ncbi:MAG: hypothetical protein QW570_08475 [Candidatus Caldarchaeum sp.]
MLRVGLHTIDRKLAEEMFKEMRALKAHGWKVARRKSRDEFECPPGVGPLELRILPVSIHGYLGEYYSRSTEVTVEMELLYREKPNPILPQGEDPPIPPEEGLLNHNGQIIGVFNPSWSLTFRQYGFIIETKLVVAHKTKTLVAYLSAQHLPFIVSSLDGWTGPVVRLKRAFSQPYYLDEDEVVYVLQALGSPWLKQVVRYIELENAAKKLAR